MFGTSFGRFARQILSGPVSQVAMASPPKTPKQPLVLPIASSPSLPAAPPPAAPAASQGVCSDSDDEQRWLQELCRAPRAPVKRSLSINSSDEAWLESLCRHSKGQRSSAPLECPVSHRTPSRTAEAASLLPPPARRPTNLSTSSTRIEGSIVRAKAKKSPPSVPSTRIEESIVRVKAQKSPSPVPLKASGATPAGPETDWIARLAAYGMPLPDSTKWQLPRQDQIVWDAPQSPPAASQEAFRTDLHRCLWFVFAWLRVLRIAAFKIGIAFDPVDRWWNDEFGYRTEQMWMFMHVMYAGPPQRCRLLEQDLVRSLRNVAGCYNERGGGEGVSATSSSASPCYCYVVFAPAGHGVSVHSSWRQRQS